MTTKLIIVASIVGILLAIGWGCAKNLMDYSKQTETHYADAMRVLQER